MLLLLFVFVWFFFHEALHGNTWGEKIYEKKKKEIAGVEEAKAEVKFVPHLP